MAGCGGAETPQSAAEQEFVQNLEQRIAAMRDKLAGLKAAGDEVAAVIAETEERLLVSTSWRPKPDLGCG